MSDPWEIAELQRQFAAHSETAFARAPLNSALCRIIAADRSLAGLLLHAPPTQRLPVLLLASVHDVVLSGDAPDLAPWYRTAVGTPVGGDHVPSADGDQVRSPDDSDALAAALRATVADHGPRIIESISTRRTQTNEVGRCALLLPAFQLVATDTARSLAHVDVGTSAGLNLLLPRFRYRYDDGPELGAHDAARAGADAVPPPLLTCGTRGDGPVPTGVPEVTRSIGIDQRPVDVSDPAEARWLRACCWPDQRDRFDRLDAALAMAATHPPDVRTADAVDGLEATLGDVDPDLSPVVTTTWVLNYLPAGRRSAFLDELDRLGSDRDLDWTFAESPALTPELPHATAESQVHRTALTLVSWRSGRRTVRHLAHCHPHGYWIHWHGPNGPSRDAPRDDVERRQDIESDG